MDSGSGGGVDAIWADGTPAPPTCGDAGAAGGAMASSPGAVSVPNPTQRHITMEWQVSGDDNLDGVVTVRFRTVGGTWRQGLPLRRVPAGAVAGFSWSNKHSGSLFGLTPDTEYEIELAMSDPDGGCAVRTETVKTRAAPAPMSGATITNVTPTSFAAAAAAAQPGDILELGAGTYAGFTFPSSGEPGKPIVIRSSVGAIIDGDVRLDGRSYVHVDGLTINGKIKFNGGEWLAILRSTINTTEHGIISFARSENCTIADNVITGATQWVESALGVNGNNVGEGIALTGPGHVIEHNRVVGFRDCISLLEGGEAVDQYSIDILGNDMENCADDGVEADFCAHNCRIVGNRMTNVFIALSSQPGLGGPTWFVRNTMYNVILSAFKLQRGSVGDVGLHNTIVKNGDAFGIYTGDVFSRQWFRNNLFIGGPGGTYGGWSSGDGRVAQLRAADPTSDFDYDGYGSTTGTFTGRIGGVSFSNLGEMRATTSEANAVELDLSVFATTVPYPATPFPALASPDLRIANASAAVDKGLALPNINDDFAGSAPDLGAHEAGATAPTYGPR